MTHLIHFHLPQKFTESPPFQKRVVVSKSQRKTVVLAANVFLSLLESLYVVGIIVGIVSAVYNQSKVIPPPPPPKDQGQKTG